MSILSKLLNNTIEKSEKLGYSTEKLSQSLVGLCVCAYAVRIVYPLLKEQLFTNDVNGAGQSVRRLNSAKTQTKNNQKLNKILCNYGNQENSINLCNDGSKQMDNNNGNDGNYDRQLSTDYIPCPDVNSQIEKAEKLLANTTRRKAESIGVNVKFFYQLKELIRIMIPRLICRETILLSVHTICLISRTFLSIYVAAMEGAIVKYIVQKDIRRFALMLLKWFGIAIPATFVNSMIRYLENKLALAFRTRLVNHSYRLYFKNQTYYRVSNLDGRIENADHRLTEDIQTFASSVAHLYSHLTKPCFDLMLIGLALMRSSQKMKANIIMGPALTVIVVSTTAHILRIVSPKFGQLVSEEANRYGYLRHIHSRIITNAEEIAFYGGQKVELLQLREAYSRLSQQMNMIFSQKLWFVMLEQFFMKYVWSGTGMVMVSLPILLNKQHTDAGDKTISTSGDGISERTQYLTTARNLLISGADAIERLMSSYKEIVELAGYTHRVAGMLKVFQETSIGVYDKQIVDAGDRNTAGILEFCNGRPVVNGKVTYTIDAKNQSISLLAVPVVTPNCDIVVLSLTLRIEPGMHLLITGPNGCGKSSLFRILSGLWPIYGGELQLPKPIEGKPSMFYIPQRPYLSIGSLRDQIIYPDTRADMMKRNITEQHLWEIMKLVALEHVVARDNFDVVRDWKDILSGGEKQRMAIARLFYHKPKYALLDECTSAVSIDVESSIYDAIKKAGITLLTITHRPTLWKFHTHVLEFDGQGGWVFESLDSNTQQNNVPADNIRQ